MAATTSVGNSGNADIDGILSGIRWASGALTYSFTTSASQYDYAIPGFEAFNDAQKAAVKSAYANYSAVANLTFTEVSGGAGTLRFAESDDPTTAYAYYPDSSDVGGDSFFNHLDYNSAPLGSYSYLTFMHEIGHSLGLDHGQDGMAALPTDHDSLEYSVMTYRSFVGADLTGYTVAEGSYPTTLMMADIAAIQYMYGANFSTNAGNSVYKWNPTTGAMTLNGVSQGQSTTNTVFMTVWDGGGTDTYDFSSYTSNLNVDLTPGEWTTTSTVQLAHLGFAGEVARGNIANAWLYKGNTASLIENATGGSGNDAILGNEAKNLLKGGGGNDSLTGLSGNDTLDGGAGSDTCYFLVPSTECIVTYDASAKAYLVTTAGGGTDTVTGIEFFGFSDKTVTAGVMTPDAPMLMSSSPADGDGNVKDSTDIVLTFSEAIVAGKGKIVIRQSDGTIFQTFDVASKPAGLTISGKTLTLDPTGYFKAGAGYYVTIDAGAVKDKDGNAFSGIASKSDLNFTIEKGIIRGTAQSETMSGSITADKLYGEGGNDALIGRAGDDILNGGAGADNMSGGRDDDRYYVNHTGDKVVEAVSQGTDTVYSSISFALPANVEKLVLTGSAAIDGTGNSLANTLTGNGAGNRLKGGAGSDSVNGGAGGDTLYGELGRDTLTGGSGKDKFVFNTAAGSTNADIVTDFSVKDDTIVLARSIFGALSTGALSDANFAKASDSDANKAKIVYDSATGSLFYDKDGSGSAGDVKFAQLHAGLALTAADFLII